MDGQHFEFMSQTIDMNAIDPLKMIKPRRKIEGISAILLPFQANGEVDWEGFKAHVRRTAAAGLAPAVNMDTGFGNLIDDGIRSKALDLTRSELGNGNFVAGAFVLDQQGAAFNGEAYAKQMEMIQQRGERR